MGPMEDASSRIMAVFEPELLTALEGLCPSRPGDDHRWYISGSLLRKEYDDALELRVMARCARCHEKVFLEADVGDMEAAVAQSSGASGIAGLVVDKMRGLVGSLRDWVSSVEGRSRGGCQDSMDLRAVRGVMES